MRLTTVLFDWDGTLCDSAAPSLRAFQKMFAEFGIDFTAARHDEIYQPDWYEMYRALDFPECHWPQADQRWLHHFRDEHPDLIDGAGAALDQLSERGLRLGIVSGGTRSRIESELRRMGRREMFGVLVCNEDVAHRKPHPEGLERAMQALDCPTAACCFVGDTPEDILMGKTAGVLTVGVTSGYVSGEKLLESGADVLLHSVRELPAVAARWSGGA